MHVVKNARGQRLFRSRSCFKGIVCVVVLIVPLGNVALAQSVVPITPSGLHTTVSDPITVPGGTQYDITGGTRPGGASGTNLFHSFGDFSVQTNNIANFLNAGSVDLNGHVLASNLPTSNILGRVTGGDPSAIFGMIQTNGPNGFGTANLFLMNPAGFLFGPNATVNVGGMMTFTTADYLRFQGTNSLFNKVSTSESLSLLSTVPVEAFGFLDSNPAAIAIQGSTLRVAQGQTLSFVGGNTGFKYIDPDTGIRSSTSIPGGVTMTGGKLLAFGGQVNLASVASPGEVSAVDFMPTAGMTMGKISLSQGAMLNVTGNAAGTVRIRGGEFVITESTVSADTINAHGASTAIDINVTGNMSIANNTVPALTAKPSGSGNAGEILITSNNLTALTTPNDSSFALIDSHTGGTGQAGNVTIHTGTLDARAASNSAYLIDSGTAAGGNGNNVTITAKRVSLNDMNISTGDFRAIFSIPENFNATGSGGNITIHSDTLSLAFAALTSQAFQGQAGDVTLTAQDISFNSTLIGSTGLLGSGAVTITANEFTMTNGTQIESETAFAPGKDITITTNVFELTNGSTIRTQTSGPEPAGNIVIAAENHITLADPPTSGRPSGFYSNSIGVEDVELDTLGGNAGSIVVTTPRLTMLGGARIDTTTQTSGRGGDVTISANELISISGERAFPIPEDFFSLGSTTSGGVFTRTIGGQFCSGPCGNAGNVFVTTGSLTIESGGQINSSTSTAGRGGEITIHASDMISLSGTLSDGSQVGIFSRTIGTDPGSRSGGNIALTAGQSVTISNGASVSASSAGPGNAGNVSINAGQQFEMRDSSLTTQATQASGGNINIQAVDRIHLVNSPISTSVRSGPGSGGNITIDPNVVVLQNSPITAQADRGAGGNITITTPLFLADSTSPVSASSQFGRNGTVTIQSPTSNLSESLGTLPSEPGQAQTLLTQRCAALANGQTSSFVVAGREQLPSDPGGWLSGPIALAGIDVEQFGEGTVVEGTSHFEPRTSGLLANDRVSLRRLTPAGFLIANLADSEATGCHS